MNDKSLPASTGTSFEEIQITAVEPADYSLVLDVLETAFPDLSRSFFHTITMKDPWYQPKFTLAVQKGHRYLSSLQIFDRTMIVDGQSIRFGGIGSVGTRPISQGKGYARALLERAIEVMEAEGMQGSMLFTHINPFYEKLGWNTLVQKEQDILVARLQDKRPRPEFYRPMRENDTGCVEAIYASRQRSISGTLRRTPDYWRERIGWMNHSPVTVLNGNEIAAYFYAAQYDESKPVLTITEYGFNQVEESVFDLFMGAMARKAESMNCRTIRGFFRNDPDLRDYLDHRNLIDGEKDHCYLLWRDLGDSTCFETLEALNAQYQFTYWQTDGF